MRQIEPAPGPELFARYAYPPNSHGYCGPADPAELLGAASEHAMSDLRHLAARFEGAWPYLQLIAGCNGLADPLDRRVVEAYWVGNELLARVPYRDLARSLEERFGRRAGRDLEHLVIAAPGGGAPHHSFHVFAVYPWLGMLQDGRVEPALTVLDRCRIRWGRVTAVAGDRVRVRNQVLRFAGSRLQLGPPVEEEARCATSGLLVGDTVSLHWDWVCEPLGPSHLAALRSWTAHNLAVVNATARPGPAVAAGA